MSEEEISPERKRLREEALKKWREENAIEGNPEEDDPENKKKKATEISIHVESKTNLEQSKLWNESLGDLQKAYSALGKDFDPESVRSSEDMQFHFDTLVRLQKAERASAKKGKEEPSGGMPLTAAQYGNDEAIPASWEDIPLDLIPFESEEQMVRTLRKQARQNFNLERKAEATKLLDQLFKKSQKENQTWELESELKDTQTTEFDEKGRPIGRKKYKLVRKR